MNPRNYQQRRTCKKTETSTCRNDHKTIKTKMFSSSFKIFPIIPIFVCFLLLVCPSLCQVDVSNPGQPPTPSNHTLRPEEEIKKMVKSVRDHLNKINKPPVKTIRSPDGDTIDCVVTHQQPAFDHPKLKGQRPSNPPATPKGQNSGNFTDSLQLWSLAGESCPEGTIPIRRTTEEDILRASSIGSYGRKPTSKRIIRRDSTSSGHEHAVGYVNGNQYYGAKASINVWAPRVVNQNEFSLSQIWLISGSFGNDLNTMEAGWQVSGAKASYSHIIDRAEGFSFMTRARLGALLVSPEIYGDNYPRFFTYWTNDAYQASGCYNLLCSGFVQTSNKIAIGAAISPRSAYKGGQFDITLLIWKDPKHGHWWLQYGSGLLVGYWPSFLFTHLRDHATMVQFGGEIVNTRPSGFHTSTQMGSGHFSSEGFGKASYFRNLQVVDWDNSLLAVSDLRFVADHPNCYDIRGGFNKVWGKYFYYGGPGRNIRCP